MPVRAAAEDDIQKQAEQLLEKAQARCQSEGLPNTHAHLQGAEL